MAGDGAGLKDGLYARGGIGAGGVETGGGTGIGASAAATTGVGSSSILAPSSFAITFCAISKLIVRTPLMAAAHKAWWHRWLIFRGTP